MRSLVDAGQVLEVKVGVDLGSRDTGVPQQLLYAAQLTARFQQMGGKRVAEKVGVDVHAQTLPDSPLRHELLDRPGTQPPAASADEQGGLTGLDQHDAL